jgi:hypothetical protein
MTPHPKKKKKKERKAERAKTQDSEKHHTTQPANANKFQP